MFAVYKCCASILVLGQFLFSIVFLLFQVLIVYGNNYETMESKLTETNFTPPTYVAWGWKNMEELACSITMLWFATYY